MKEIAKPFVERLLYEFSALSKEQQDQFLVGVDNYIFASPVQRKGLRERWQRRLPPKDFLANE
ncbi:hypothetical protein [Dyella japonica]|uniref:Uncharacterized protein n=1 Tax=Dyella japonica TaxID=231455 RepID=A0ABV2K3Z0_9GAMM